jgi:hypothetical protein
MDPSSSVRTISVAGIPSTAKMTSFASEKQFCGLDLFSNTTTNSSSPTTYHQYGGTYLSANTDLGEKRKDNFGPLFIITNNPTQANHPSSTVGPTSVPTQGVKRKDKTFPGTPPALHATHGGNYLSAKKPRAKRKKRQALRLHRLFARPRPARHDEGRKDKSWDSTGFIDE